MFEMDIDGDASMLDTVPLSSSQSALSQEPHTPPIVRANATAHNFFPSPPRSDSPYATQPLSVDERENSPVGALVARSMSVPIIPRGNSQGFLRRRNATATCDNVKLPADEQLRDPGEQFAMTHVGKSFRSGSSGKQ